jgi:hypothetical protein
VSIDVFPFQYQMCPRRGLSNPVRHARRGAELHPHGVDSVREAANSKARPVVANGERVAIVDPVVGDQRPNLELTRTIARRFNERYSPRAPLFPAPERLLSTAPLVLSLDGQKMSNSRRNAIPLGSTEDETATLLRRAKTDSERTITYEPATLTRDLEPRPARDALPGTLP